MNRNKIKRLIIGSAFPPLIGSLLLMSVGLYNTVINKENFSFIEYSKSFLVLLLFAYLTIGLQSILYSFIMEFVINKRINNSKIYYLSSAVAGFILGMSLMHITWGIIGLITSMILSVILRNNYLKSEKELTKNWKEDPR
jgi:hypothetical protein